MSASAPSTVTPTSHITPPSTASIVWQVAQREIRVRLRSVAFLVSSGILLLVVLASVLVGGFVSANPTDVKVAVVAQEQIDFEGLDITVVDSEEEALELVRDGTVEAAILENPEAPGTARIVADREVPTELVALLSTSPPVELLDPNAPDPFLSYLVALGFGIIFFVSAMTFGSTIAQSVVEEKSTRVIEVLLSTISTRALLAGKILGTSLLAYAQIALLVAVTLLGMSITGQTELLAGLSAPVGWFAVFFVVGFVLLAALFAATAAMVSRQEDIGATTTPVTILVMLPYFLVIFFNNNELVLAIMSYIPFSAPIAMPLRLFLGTAQWWEPFVSLAILIATTLAVIALGARIYENALLKLGSRVPWREALARK
jgi:ABC-2 type transport system permease protein